MQSAPFGEVFPGGVPVPPGEFAGALLVALPEQSGGAVVVDEEIYRRAVARILAGWQPVLRVEQGAEPGRFTVRLGD